MKKLPDICPAIFLSSGRRRGAFFLAVPAKGAFLLPAVRGAGAKVQPAEACQPGRSDPSYASHIRKAAKPPTAIGILLSCAKKNGVGRQEEVAQRKPLERVFSGLFPKTEGLRPLWLPGGWTRRGSLPRSLDIFSESGYTEHTKGATGKRAAPRYWLKEVTAICGTMGGYFFLLLA